MNEKILAVYSRPDNYRGYSRINHYHYPVQIRCTVTDNSDLRAAGVLVNGHEVPDDFDILEMNYLGKVTYRHHFTDRASANDFFKNLRANLSGLARVQ